MEPNTPTEGFASATGGAAKGQGPQQTPAVLFGIEEPLNESPIYLGEEEGTPKSLLEMSSPSTTTADTHFVSAQTGGGTAYSVMKKKKQDSPPEETSTADSAASSAGNESSSAEKEKTSSLTTSMPTLKNFNELEKDSKVVLENFDFQSQQLREELLTFKNSLMNMARTEQQSSTTTTPAFERVYKGPEINPLHSKLRGRDRESERNDDEVTSSETYSSQPESPKFGVGGPSPSPSPLTSSAAPSLLGTPVKGGAGEKDKDHSMDRLSKILRHNGFALHLAGGPEGDENAGRMNGVLSAFFQVLNQYERRGKLIQEMLASNELSVKQEQRLEAKVRKIKLERDEAKRDLNLLSDKFEAKLSRSLVEKRSASEGSKKLGTEKGKIQSKLTHMEHIVRAREKEIDSLQNKMREKMERDERRKKRDKEIYDKLRHKVSRQSSGSVSAIVRELRPVEIVGIYESQREVLESELTALRTDLHETKTRLEQKEQYILNKDMAGNWKTPAEGEILNTLALSEKAAADSVRKLAEIESRAAEAAKNAAKDLAEEHRKNEVLAEENASLILELESRPQLKDLQAAQRQIEILERKISSLQTFENKENLTQDLKSEVSKATSAKIRKDRKLFQLGLHKVQNLPHSVLVQIVQDSCLKVELTDPTVLSQSLGKLLRIVAAVPRMERFVGAVCEITLQDGINYIPKDIKGTPEPKNVPRVLQHWLNELKKLHDLQLLYSGLVGELQHRSSATKPKGKTTGGIMASVKEMIVAERAFHQMKATFDNANQIMKDNPEELLSKIVAHFQRLFNCKNLEGTFAAINQTYLALTESKNFFKALRNLVGLDRSAGINACLARVRQLVLLQAQKYAEELDDGEKKEEEEEEKEEGNKGKETDPNPNPEDKPADSESQSESESQEP